MTDTPVKKSILHLIRDGLRHLLHFMLIPVVALCKGLAVLFTHLHDEFAKI